MDCLEKSIAEILISAFGNKYPVYNSFIKSDFDMPAFVVEPIILSIKHFLGNKFMKSYEVTIKFYCNNSDKNTIYPEICETLSNALEYIKIDGDLIRGNKLKLKSLKDCLEISICYEYFFFKKYTIPYMENLDVRKKEDKNG